MSSDSDLENATALILLTGTSVILSNNKQKHKRKKTREWLNRRLKGKGILRMVNDELLKEDLNSYRNYLRMSNESFQSLLQHVEADISKINTFMRDSIPARSRLQVTLRYLASGETYRSLMYATRIHETTISRFIPEVCQAIYKNLKNVYLKIPTSEREWEEIAEQFYSKWDFPNCIGALDGRHIKFKPPNSSGSYFFNYKGYNSIVLLGLVDANYKFLYINVGVNGRISDGGVFRESFLSRAIDSNLLNFPPAKPLPGRLLKVPYVIVADDAFPLSDKILKPYSSRMLSRECRIFNYRLSRARRMVESAFGILANRFRILLNAINLSVEKTEQITLCCVALHNFLINETVTVGNNRCEDILEALNIRQAGNRNSSSARSVRDEFKEFFNGVGAREWQDDQIVRFNM